MDQQTKKRFTDLLQKNLTRNCYKKCREDQQCFNICYDKYIKAIGIVNTTIKDIAYSKHSLIGYKGYPEHNIQILYHMRDQLFTQFDTAPFGIQHQSGA